MTKIKIRNSLIVMISKQGFILLLIFSLQVIVGCSTVGYEKHLEPVQGNDWMVSGSRPDAVTFFGNAYEEDNLRVIASYKCNTTILKTGGFSISSMGAIGPPVVPIIPMWISGNATLIIDVEDKVDPWMGGCPEVISTNYEKSKFKLYIKNVTSDSTRYRCRYKISGLKMKEIDELKLVLKLKKCETKSLQFKKYYEIKYCMACVPRIAG